MSQSTKKSSALLVVSDNFLAKQLTDSLHILGYKTVRAALARDCYSAWSSPERFSICLIDQHLADQPGQVVAKYLAENRAKNVVLFGKLDNAENRLSLSPGGVSLILRDPDGTAEIVAAMLSMATPDQTPVTKRASVVRFRSTTSGTNVPWQVRALQREVVATSGDTGAVTRTEGRAWGARADTSRDGTNRAARHREV